MMKLLAFALYWIAVTMIAWVVRVDRGCGCKNCRRPESVVLSKRLRPAMKDFTALGTNTARPARR
jgi:hypothetical protein